MDATARAQAREAARAVVRARAAAVAAVAASIQRTSVAARVAATAPMTATVPTARVPSAAAAIANAIANAGAAFASPQQEGRVSNTFVSDTLNGLAQVGAVVDAGGKLLDVATGKRISQVDVDARKRALAKQAAIQTAQADARTVASATARCQAAQVRKQRGEAQPGDDTACAGSSSSSSSGGGFLSSVPIPIVIGVLGLAAKVFLK